MHFLGYLVLTTAKIISLLVNFYTFIVAIAVIISWVRPDPYNPIVRLLRQLTEPVFGYARKWIPSGIRYRIGIDFAPLVVFIGLIAIDTLGVGLLFELSASLMQK